MNADDVLMPIEKLAPLDGAALRRLDAAEPSLSDWAREGEAGKALVRSFMFERWPELLGDAVDPERLFYNRYFWFLRFATLRQAAHGPDAGLEQQAFKMLEYPEFDVDFQVVNELVARARNATT